MTCHGEPSLYNSLNMAMQTLKHMPGHTSREVLIIFSSLTTCDPSNIYDLVKTVKAAKIRVSVIGLSAEVRVCTILARETGGTYHVILDESHYKELLTHHVSPPPASSNSECSLIRMGFPQHTIASLSDQDAKPSFSMAHLDSSTEPGLTLGGYFCPQCRAKYCELPVECKICGLTLVSAPHLARSYHHLFPLDAFQEIPLQEYNGERFCYGCQGELKDQHVYVCSVCQNVFCVDCDVFVHDSLHCCPGCIHKIPAPSVAASACESWTINKEDRRRIDAFALWCWQRVLNIPWTTRRINKSLLEEVQPEFSLEMRMARICLTYSGHVIRRDQSLEKDIMLGKCMMSGIKV
ncbi:general transcription factor IIH subunit 2-like protein isoform 7-T9 [Trichechus inunguis]